MSEAQKVKKMPTYDFSQVIVDYYGEPFTKPDVEGGGEWTLGDVASSALLSTFPDKDKALDAKQKGDLFHLAMRLRDAEGHWKEVPLKSNEVTLILDRIARGHSTIVYGRCMELLEGVIDTEG